jgi:hypothetical protein
MFLLQIFACILYVIPVSDMPLQMCYDGLVLDKKIAGNMKY